MPRRLVSDVSSTPHFDFLYGAFKLSRWKIPYFATTMSLPEVADVLHVTSEIPGAEEIQWKVDELFQRDIDWPRVERQITPYLRNTEVPQFFNAVTVALLPYDADAGELKESFDGVTSWQPPELSQPDRFAKRMTVGPISFGFWSEWSTPEDREFQTGQIRWNVRELFGVAIDGQHRLAAIKGLIDGVPLTAELRNTRLPVILLIFDPRIGFVKPDETTQVELLRALFIDLNKHAKTVSRDRQILLDDRDPHAMSVRRLVGNQLRPDLGELEASPPALPLSLVDWHSEQARFDTGPYLTTILGLDWIVTRVLDSRPIKDFTSYTDVRRQLDALERRLDISLRAAKLRVEELATVKLRPFTYTDQELDEICEAFARIWARPLCRLLTQFEPYAGVIRHRRISGTLSLDFQYWFTLFERKQDDPFAGHATDEYKRLLGRLMTREIHPLSEDQLRRMLNSIEDVKAGSLAFNVVFQRAIVDAFLEYAKIEPRHVEELQELSEEAEMEEVDFGDEFYSSAYDESEEDDEGDVGVGPRSVLEDDEEGLGVEDVGGTPASDGDIAGLAFTAAARSEEFVGVMNRLVAEWPDVLNVNVMVSSSEHEAWPFWLGTLLRAEGGIDFTQGASVRAKDLLFLAGVMSLYSECAEGESEFDEFWGLCHGNNPPSALRRAYRAIGRLCRSETSAGGRIVRASGQEYSRDSAKDAIYQRMSHLWRVMEL